MDSNALVHGGVTMEEFIACFSDVSDPRRENIRHDLHEVLMIALCTMLCGGEDCSDMAAFGHAKAPFLRQFLRLRHGIPSHDTFSRLFRQRAICAQIVAQGGDYVIALKGNQGSLHADVRLFLEDPNRTVEACHTTVDAGHGRIETRTGEVCADIAWLQKQHDWPGLVAIAKIVRTRETKTKTTPGTPRKSTTETTYYLLSAPLAAQRFTDVAQAHWGVENGLHWVLDVTMNEDRTRHCKDHGPENIALLRRLALNLASVEGSKGSMKGKLKRAGWNDNFLASLLSQFNKIHMR